jgi:hypothetical protein
MYYYCVLNNNVVEKIIFTEEILEETADLKQTSYDTQFRKNFGCVGYFYNENLDAFISPKPYDSWILNETTGQWEAPIQRHDDQNLYVWNEETLSWNEIVEEIPQE